MLTILITLTSLVLYLLVGFTIARILFKDDEVYSIEQQEEQERWFVLVSFAWPFALLICVIINTKDIIKEFKKNKDAR